MPEERVIPEQLDVPVGAYDHLQGVLGAEFGLVKYGDFECPYCRAAVPVIEEVRRELGDRLVYAFRHFPLFELHPFALAAACASEGAALVGQFWPMHDLLFAGDEPALTQDDIRSYAVRLGVDPATVLWPGTQLVEDRVEADFNSGVRSGVLGTPTLFVNGQAHQGPITVRSLMDAFEKAAASQT